MKTLVLVEHEGGKLKDATLAAVTAAAKLGSVDLLVAGQDVGGVAEAAAKIAGIGNVHVADDAAYAHGLAENVAPLAAQLMAGYDAFLAPATTTGKNIAPRVAALLDVMQISDILSVEGEDTFTRPIYAGNAIATVKSSDAKKVITVRGTAFEKAAAEGGSGTIVQAPGTGDNGLSSYVGAELSKSERPELTSAKIIVSGGRAFGSSDQFHALLDPLADKLKRRRRRQPRRGRRRLCAERLSGRPDRQDRRARSLYRDRHFGRDPAPRRHEGFGTDVF
jgi:electron transfer flavoprotein alpha subunit